GCATGCAGGGRGGKAPPPALHLLRGAQADDGEVSVARVAGVALEEAAAGAVGLDRVADDRFVGVPELEVLPEVLAVVGAPEALLAAMALPAAADDARPDGGQRHVEPDDGVGPRPADIEL